jgi:hypothetical protein
VCCPLKYLSYALGESDGADGVKLHSGIRLPEDTKGRRAEIMRVGKYRNTAEFMQLKSERRGMEAMRITKRIET